MSYKRLYIVMVVCIILSGGILAWTILYGDFYHHAPVRARQVLYLEDRVNSDIEKHKKMV